MLSPLFALDCLYLCSMFFPVFFPIILIYPFSFFFSRPSFLLSFLFVLSAAGCRTDILRLDLQPAITVQRYLSGSSTKASTATLWTLEDGAH
eukprot:m.328828 g.328828  ORF g.328828 m.328828 type:complete len:92 (+) comp55592_c0_seq34:95-370(+)